MKIALMTGSFNNWHQGHDSILQQALTMFDQVIICQGQHPEKPAPEPIELKDEFLNDRVGIDKYQGTIIEFIKEHPLQQSIVAIVRGLRNTTDFEYEKIQQYYNQDLGLTIPIIYLIANRNLTHISSSGDRILKKLKEKDNG